MELAKMIEDYNNASKEQDPSKMMGALQVFFTSIHAAGRGDGAQLLGIYSMAEQLSTLGMNTEVLKKAVTSRILALNEKYPSLMKEIVGALRHLQKNS